MFYYFNNNIMKKIIFYTVIGALFFAWILWSLITRKWWNQFFSFKNTTTTINTSTQKIYIANEWDSSVSVIDATNKMLIKSISLSQQYYGKFLKYSAHNVQVSPKGTIVAVTANILEEKNVHGDEMVNSDQLILIDPNTDTIVGRIEMGIWEHLAHVVIDATDSFAYVVSQEKWKVYIINLSTKKMVKEIKLSDWAQPHGIRLSPDGKNLYIAMIGDKSLGIMNTQTFLLEYIPVWDKVVQVAVTPDGKYVFASLYHTKSIARYDILNKRLENILLPNGSKWPIQMYPTPDSRFLYIADQWFYFDEPTNNQIYKIDIASNQVVKRYTWWQAPHGVVVSPDGKIAYITNLLSDTVSVIDTTTDMVTDTISVGKKPNGISIRTKWIGGTP